ncbi:hypothetical protein KDW_37280 [Dictyobacter vulcani]|uniref:Uncharacterized protein n=1 Tax=Dictyobacter vulcani TaxID=2607529 RepID=A0A5J4KWH9_9CHLR|nr:hypothetical protein [Dictyobacter vulcani]GER89566.1 hypothetical protein KDW_37280 [Dictyobacter vulcani]
MSGLPPYRERALEHYAQQNQTTVLPRLISLRTALYLWIVLAILLVAVVVSWFGRIPVFTTGSGIVLGQSTDQTDQGLYAFLSPAQRTHMRVGQTVQVQLGNSGPAFTTVLEWVSPRVITPSVARQHFVLGSRAWGVLIEPAVVVKLMTPPGFSLRAFSGSVITVRLQVGSRPVLALIPGVGQFVGDDQ